MTDYTIPFTQYLLPNGERRPMSFHTTREDVFLKAEEIRKQGFHFECEVLTTGHYSGTIGDEYGDYAHVIVPARSPDVQPMTEEMIMEFDIQSALKESEEARG